MIPLPFVFILVSLIMSILVLTTGQAESAAGVARRQVCRAMIVVDVLVLAVYTLATVTP